MSEQNFEVLLTQTKHFKDIPVTSYMGHEGWARAFMKKNHSEIKMNQLRNFFNEIKRVKGNFSPSEKVKLETNLAYDYGRSVITKDFYEIISRCLAKTNDNDDFDNFVNLMETLIAYHKLATKEKGA